MLAGCRAISQRSAVEPSPLALMSPDGSDRDRNPLEPVHDNILLVAGEPPPLELPDPLKGPQAIEDEPEELMREAELEDEETNADSLASSLATCSSSSAGTLLAASDEALAQMPRSQPLAMPMKRDSTDMQTERPDFGLSSSAPAFAVSHQLTVKMSEDEGAASAIQALLALQRDDSPSRAPVRSWSTLSDVEMSLGRVLSDSRTACLDACPSSPALSAQSMDERPIWPATLVSSKQGKDGTARFYCRFPKCGKGYASTDAVRKHCRQRHLEWLRRLGHGCPALYCRWSADVLENVLALQDDDGPSSPR